MVKKKSKWGLVLVVLIILWVLASVLSSFISLFSGSEFEVGGNVALIKIKGTITSEKDGFGAKVSSAPEIVKLIDKAGKNPQVKAIMFEINSPGGSAVASKEIADAVLRVNKTTLALIREIGTSGAYWIASAADTIVASPISITGSIGVIASYLEFDKLFEKYGINYQRLVSGKYKDIGSPFRELSEEENKILQKQIDKVHDFFIRQISKNRKLKVEDVSKIANGLFFLGEEAYNYGLVDFLGDKETARIVLQKKLNLDTVKFTEYKTPKTFVESLFEGLSGYSYSVGRGIGEGLVGKDDNVVKV